MRKKGAIVSISKSMIGMNKITKQIVIILVLAFHLGCERIGSDEESEGLFEWSTNGSGIEKMDIRMEEVRRDSSSSLVRIEYHSGSSVPSSVFIACGLAELAKQRGFRFFIKADSFSEKEDEYLIGFPQSNTNEAIINLGEEFQDYSTSDIIDIQTLDPVCSR